MRPDCGVARSEFAISGIPRFQGNPPFSCALYHMLPFRYIAAIDLLVMEGQGQAATDYIKEKLLEGDIYRQKVWVLGRML